MPELVESFKLHVHAEDDAALRGFVSFSQAQAADEPYVEACHLMATDEDNDVHAMHTMAASVSQHAQSNQAR